MRPHLPIFATVFLLMISVVTVAQVHEKTSSVLASGEWHKISVEEEGIYVIDKGLVDEAGFSPSEAARLVIYGNHGGMLPQLVSGPRTDDLVQVRALRIGLEDGSFDASDKIIFYAQGPTAREVDPESKRISSPKNIYDLRNHYFVGVSDGTPVEQISVRESLSEGDITINTFDDHVRLEEDRVNLLGKFRQPGSGKAWFGDEFSAVRERNYNVYFPNIATGTEVKFLVEFAGRSGSTSNVFVRAGGTEVSKAISRVSLGNAESSYALIVTVSGSYLADNDIQEVEISYPQGSGLTEGWLDYIEMQAKRRLIVDNGPLIFRSFESVSAVSSTFELDGLSQDHLVWDITNPLVPVEQQFKLNGDEATFTSPTEGVLREFVAFRSNGSHSKPRYEGSVANQNLHAIDRADLVIIYHSDFEEPALELAQHRMDHNGYAVAALTVEEVMNEFAGGSMDPTAIRDFAAMLHRRDPDFRFMLFVGDGTYDYRHLNSTLEDDNFVPVYETYESMHPIRSFPSDDYFSLLNDNEGNNLRGAIDISVGRLTVGNLSEASAVIEKIIHYDISPTTLGDWRQKIVFVADDEDTNLHLNQTEEISDDTEDANTRYNIDRIYLDAFEQVSTPGGPRYPDVNAAINRNMFKGMLAINYLGHGGPQGWAQERILRADDIASWNNFDKLPLFITATCSFTGYDEPGYVSAGEQVLLNPGGGAVGLLTTVRPVYSSSNKRLTEEVFNHLFETQNGKPLAIGEIMRLSKNSNQADTIDINARKFAIIADPSMVLAYPKHNIVITELNGNPVGTEPDTAGALDQVHFKAEIQDANGTRIPDFNGKANVTLYDKKVVIRTLNNDPKSPSREFDNYSRIIFKGSATVVNGEFEVSFVIPKDINFDFGRGKISMYASDQWSIDASGSYEELVIGGSSIENLDDFDGPEIALYMNNESFKSGDKVSPNSTLLVKLYDENGINVTGNSIGHDLVAELDGESSFVLNDFYEASENDFRRGVATYPFANIPAGKHSITVTAWDAANNFSQATIEFVVDDDPSDIVRNALAYPNPATVSGDVTFRIEHNLAASSVDVAIDIYDLMGRQVSTVQVENAPSSNGVIDGITWDGNNSTAVAGASGMLIYQVRLTTNSAGTGTRTYEGGFNKLILLN